MANPEEGTTPDPADLSDAELERLQQEEDGEAAGTDPVVDGDADPDAKDGAGAAQAAAAPTPTPEPTPEPTPAPTPAPAAAEDAGADKGKIEGVLSKDGKTVIPYTALQAERRAAKAATGRASALEKELAAAKQQIDDLKSGKTPIEDVTEEDVKQMEADFPADGAKFRRLWERAQAAPSAAPKPAEGDGDDDPVTRTQELIDHVPLLLKWQHEDAEKFTRAVEHDALLMKSPKWAGKPAIDRFTEATRRTADEYDVPFEDKPKASGPAAAPAPTSAPAAAPNAAAPEPARRNPETLSEFKGGATPDHGSLDIRGSNPNVLLNKFMDMSDEDIDAQLAKLG